MRIYTLEREMTLPIPISEAWKFFSSAGNLAQITPPDLGLEVLTQLAGGAIYTGMEISYRVRPLLGIPLGWTTLIKDVQAPVRFADVQVKGPYALWEHTHKFAVVAGGTLMRDEIRYALPMGWLGVLAHGIVVEKKLKEIFRFREAKLKQLFG